ncbi:MAG: TldD/PmbA family protein [Spirochaetales bacterium]|nr:TldD/PmbA family protein [Spirochaetales bacterium]
MIEKNLTGFIAEFPEYTELRMQENTSLNIAYVNGNLMANNRNVQSGISARVYKNGVWGFASHPDLTEQSAKSVVKAATDNARFLDSREKRGNPSLPQVSGTMEKAFFTKKKRLNQNELIGFLKEIDVYIGKNLHNVMSRTVILRTLDMEKSLITSAGTVSYSMIPRSNIIILLSADKEGAPVELYNVFGSLGQFEDVFENPGDLFKGIDVLHGHLMKKREGVFAQAGVKECILDSHLAGILAHEALGHTTEADLILGGSVAPEYLEKEAASPLISIIDFANTALEVTCPVPVYIDDEGTPAKDAVIIDKGILKGYMHSKETALHFSVNPTGNARAYLFSDEPIIRMRNTAILPGRDKLDDMIKSIDDGYYLLMPSNGQADSTGEFTFGIPLGYEIKQGKLQKAILDTTISGIAFDMLKTVTMVSDEMVWENGGFCGKKQMIPVGMGGPAIKCSIMIGGK